jgi:multiple sugar transport system permease protein
VFLSIWPLIRLVWLSFTDYSVTRDVPASFIGFDNYIDVLTSPVTQKRAVTTLIFVVGAGLLQTLLGFAIAFLISRRTEGPRRAHDDVPDPDDALADRRRPVLEVHARRAVRRRELVPELARLGSVEWLTKQRLALFSLVIVDTWQWTPFIMLIALAGLTAVPEVPLRGGRDRPRLEWFKFRRITFPLVWPLLLIAVMFRAIERSGSSTSSTSSRRRAGRHDRRRSPTTSTRSPSSASTPGARRRTGSSW